MSPIYLNTWSPVGRIDWKGLGGVAFLEEVCHLGAGFEALKAHTIFCELTLLLLMGQMKAISSSPVLPATTVMDAP